MDKLTRGQKIALTNLAKDPNYYRIIGTEGGKKKNPKKGFGSDRKLASEAGKIGKPYSRKKNVH